MFSFVLITPTNFLISFLITHFFSSYSSWAADFSGKENVKINDLLLSPWPRHDSQLPRSTNRSNDLPQRRREQGLSHENLNEYGKVGVRIMGAPIDNNILQPKTQHMNSRQLRRVLGQQFDDAWMSVESQPMTSRFIRNHLPTGNEYDPLLVNQANKLNFTFTDSSGVTLQMQPKMLQQLRTWMLNRASCPMEYIWEDLGILFWPRYIRRGLCLNTHSCSWPPGMICKPAGARDIQMLHWTCMEDPQGVLKKTRDVWLHQNRQKRARSRQQNNRWMYDNQPENMDDQDGYSNNAQRPPSFSGKRGNSGGGSNKKKEAQNHRAERIIQKLTLTESGYFCQWKPHKYAVNEQCVCTCG